MHAVAQIVQRLLFMQRPSRETRVQHQQRYSLLLLPMSIPFKMTCQCFLPRSLGFSPGECVLPYEQVLSTFMV